MLLHTQPLPQNRAHTPHVISFPLSLSLSLSPTHLIAGVCIVTTHTSPCTRTHTYTHTHTHAHTHTNTHLIAGACIVSTLTNPWIEASGQGIAAALLRGDVLDLAAQVSVFERETVWVRV